MRKNKITLFILLLFGHVACGGENERVADLFIESAGIRTSEFKRLVKNTLSDLIQKYDTKDKQWELLLGEETYFLNYQSEQNLVVGLSLNSEKFTEETYEGEMQETWDRVRDIYSFIHSKTNSEDKLKEHELSFPSLTEIKKADGIRYAEFTSTIRSEFAVEGSKAQIIVWHYIKPDRSLVPSIRLFSVPYPSRLYPKF